LTDVAARAGVSKASASVILNGSRSSAVVSADAKERILSAAHELAYNRNAVARSLSSRRTDVLGFYSTTSYLDLHDPFMAALIAGLQDGCELLCKDLLLHGTFHGHSSRAIYGELANGKIDGLVVIARPDNPLLDLLVGSHLPVVAVADAVPNLPSVVVDDVMGSRLLAMHLKEKGHQRVLYRKSPRPFVSVERRLQGFREASHDLGLHVDEVVAPYDAVGLTEDDLQYLKAPISQRPTAAVCWADNAAWLFWRNCKEAGLRVPDDIAITGFDGVRSTQGPVSNLTTVHAPWAKVAETAISLLGAQIAHEEVPLETVLPVTLTSGETT
jgi:LacI family transcriptional regulator/LacI family purine nucleotide synthesis repressor